MPLSALGLLLLAAMCHASWNFLLKNTKETFAVTWWAMVFSCVPAVVVLIISPPLPRAAYAFAALSAIFQAGYYFALSTAYRVGDFNLVYPVARGTAPLLLMLWATLFLHEQPSAQGFGGVAIVLCGLIVMGLSNFQNKVRPHAKISHVALGWALLTALFISLYSVTDGAAVKRCPPAPYTCLIFIATTLALTPLALLRHRAVLGPQLKHWRRAALIGTLSLVSYGLALAAYSLGKVSYAGAVREISIVFGALLGWKWMNESFGPRRTLGAALMFTGIIVIALAK